MAEEEHTNCCCGNADKLKEVVKVNQFWQKDYSALMDECNNQKVRLWKTESELDLMRQENEELRKNIMKQNEEEHPRVNGTFKENALFTLDDIEALKQQLIMYKEDYNAEKEDNRNATEQQNKLKLEVRQAYDVIDNLTMKVNNIKEGFRRITSEKELLMVDLRRLSTSSLPFSSVSPARRVPSNGSLTEDIVLRSTSNIHSIPESFNMYGNVVRD